MGSLKSLTLSVFACVVGIIGAAQAQQPALRFIPLAPCRIADTRDPNGPFGGPSIAAQSSRSFAIPNSACGVPSTAAAYSLNVTAVPKTFLGYLTVWPTGQTQPVVSTLNSTDGRVKANAAIVPAGTGGAISVFVTDAADVVLDINGYFVLASNPSALAFFPVNPCRVADTRDPSGPFGGPALVGAQERSFPVRSSNCSIPASAVAYSLNFTAVPPHGLGFLSAWPTGITRPLVSTLNAPTGQVTANAAIVPAGTNGAISVYASSEADVIIDVNGYFAAPGSGPNPLSFYTLSPCRVLDTRDAIGVFFGTLPDDTTASPCGVLTSSQAVVLNATVVPAEPMSFLALWPSGQTRPLVSTLNAIDGLVTSNMAIVPTTSGTIDTYATDRTHLVLDTSGYFASGTAPAPTTYVLTVARAGSGLGTVAGLDNKINCGAVCAVAYPSGTAVTLNATAGFASNFANWSVGSCGSAAFCTVTVTAPTTVTANFGGGAHINLNPTSVGANLEVLATGSLDVAAPSTLSVTFSSSDPAKLLLSPDPSGASLGVASFTATIPAGKGLPGDFGFPGFWIQSLASSGTATITVSAHDYKPAVATVTLTPSGFVLNGPHGTGANFNASIGSDSTLTVSPVQLDGFGNVLSSSQVLRGGSPMNVTVNSANPAIGTILNTAVVQPGTGTSSAVAFHPLTEGPSVLSITQPSGFSSPASGAQLTATVGNPSISLNAVNLGFNQQTLGVGQLSQSPSSAINVRVTSSDPSKVLLTINPAQLGASFVDLPVAAGAFQLPAFYIQALASSGTVTLTATAPGYSCPSGCISNVGLTNSSFVLVANGQPMTSLTTSTLSDPTTLTIGLWQQNGTQPPPTVMRPGTSASVTVTSSNTSTGTISGSPVTFNPGDSSISTVTFNPQPGCTTPCTTTVSVTQPSGYALPLNGGGSVAATVNKPNLTLLVPSSTIGKNLEVGATGMLDATYPQDLKVTITRSNSNVLLSASPTAAGTASLLLTVPANTGLSGSFPDFFVQSNGVSTGTTILNATVKKADGVTDAGYNVITKTVTLAPGGFVISGSNGVGQNVSVNAGSNVVLTLSAVVLNGTTPTQVEQWVRGGLSPVPVTVISNNTAAATVVSSPVSIPAGTSSGTATVHGVAHGSATISITAPTGTNGFIAPSTGNHLDAIVP